jgi:hypothetical protein
VVICRDGAAGEAEELPGVVVATVSADANGLHDASRSAVQKKA